MSPFVQAALSVVPDLVERLVNALLGKKPQAVTLGDILSDIEIDALKNKAALERARIAVAKKKRG